MQIPPWKLRCPVCRNFFQPRHAGQIRCDDGVCRKNCAFIDEYDRKERELTKIVILLEGEDYDQAE
jgi:hypothetical protein